MEAIINFLFVPRFSDSPLANVIEFERRIVFRPGESDLRSLLPSQIAAVRIRFVRGARVTARK